MKSRNFHAYFVLRSEAARAVSQLHAAGVPEDAVSISVEFDGDDDEPREEQVGVPDNAASLEGLQGGDEADDAPDRAASLEGLQDADAQDEEDDPPDNPATGLILSVDLSDVGIRPGAIKRILNAAGGRLLA
jgi:hypothetical protein